MTTITREFLHHDLEARLPNLGRERTFLRQILVRVDAEDRLRVTDVHEPVRTDRNAGGLVDQLHQANLREGLVGLATEEPNASSIDRPTAHLRDDEVTVLGLRDAAREREPRRDDADADTGRRLQRLQLWKTVARPLGRVRVLAGLTGGGF